MKPTVDKSIVTTCLCEPCGGLQNHPHVTCLFLLQLQAFYPQTVDCHVTLVR